MPLFSKTPSTSTDDDDNLNDEERAYRDSVTPALIMRSYHLPGNTSWSSDLYQYLTNNHPIFGICCHHKYHPIGITIRIAAFIGSVLFGLAITNIIYMAFVFTQTDYNKSYLEVPVSDSNITAESAVLNQVEQTAAQTLSVTNGNIALWTIGGALHATYDNTIWALAACTCCSSANNLSMHEKSKRYKSMGTFLVMLSVVVVVALSTFAVTLRKALDDGDIPTNATAVDTMNNVNVYKMKASNNNNTTGNNNNGEVVLLAEYDSTNDLEFLIAYAIELMLSYFIYYPVIGTILFSGILGCGKCPVIGGRPYELKQEEERIANRGREEQVNSSNNKKTKSTTANNKKSTTNKKRTVN